MCFLELALPALAAAAASAEGQPHRLGVAQRELRTDLSTRGAPRFSTYRLRHEFGWEGPHDTEVGGFGDELLH